VEATHASKQIAFFVVGLLSVAPAKLQIETSRVYASSIALKVEAELASVRTRRHEMCSAER
jgi:hypothetical protein